MKEENNNAGLLRKYNIPKATGEPVSPSAEYFVLRLDNNDDDPIHVWACRKALVVYANALHMSKHLTQLSDDLMNCWGWETVACQLMIATRSYCGVCYDKSKETLFIKPLSEAFKEFFSMVSLFRISDDTLGRIALECLSDDNSYWYSETEEFKRLRAVLKDYSDSIK